MESSVRMRMIQDGVDDVTFINIQHIRQKRSGSSFLKIMNQFPKLFKHFEVHAQEYIAGYKDTNYL